MFQFPPHSLGERQQPLLVNGIKHVCEFMIKQEPVLTELDQKLADGDMGVNVSKACQSVLNELNSYPDSTDPHVIFSNLAYSLRHFGGSSGAFFSMFFVKFSETFQNKENSVSTWRDALKIGTDAISQLGGAKEGQKTLLDALYPVCRAFDSFESSGEFTSTELNRLLVLLAKAAEDGANNTENMRSGIGRSAYQGDKSIGFVDPGAASIKLLLQAVVEYSGATENKK